MLRGTQIAQAIIRATVDGSGINEDIVDEVDKAGPGVEDAGEEHGERYGDGFEGGMRGRLDRIKANVAAGLRERLGMAGRDAGENAGDEAGRSLSASLVEKTKDLGEKVSAELGERLASRKESVRRGIVAAFDDDFADRIGSRFGDHIAEALGDRIELALASVMEDAANLLDDFQRSGSGGGSRGPRVSGNNNDSGGLASLVGSLLGAGSRNNALNFIGKSIENLIGLGGKFASVFTSGFSAFAKGAAAAGEEASLFAKFTAGAGTAGAEAFAGIIASGPAALAAIVVITAAMSVLASVAVALLGIITALVSTIASALVGALLVAGGALAAVVASAGLLVAAFTSLDNTQKDLLANSFRPLKEEFTGLGQLILQDLIPYTAEWARNLQQALALAGPVASIIGDSFGRAGAQLSASLAGPGFQQFFAALTVYLPGIVTALSTSLGGFLNGLASTFAALLPYVLQFSNYLADVATRFANWASSAQGQNAIEDFVNRALDSLRSLWGFVRELGGLITDVLFDPSAQNAGNGIFDGLTDALKRARRAIADGRLEKWFEDAIQFGTTLWQVMGALGNTFKGLYDSGVLEATGDAFKVIAFAFDSVNFFLDPMVRGLGGLIGVVTDLLGPLFDAADRVLRLGDAVQWVKNLLGQDNPFPANPDSLNDLAGLLDPGGTMVTVQNGQAVSTLPPRPPINFPTISIPSLVGLGQTALNNTYQSDGGYVPDPVKPDKPDYVNPYIDLANSLIQSVPSVKQQMRQAIRQLNSTVKDAILTAGETLGSTAVADLLGSQVDALKDMGRSLVDSAQSTLSSAAERLANATNKADAKAALKEVRKDQRDLAAALAAQERLGNAAKILNAQQIVTASNVSGLLSGLNVANATLADFAEAREQLVDRLADANQALTDAIALRNNYAQQVADSARTFGSILTASAQSLNGIQQALTAGDITSNLRDRLASLQTFQDNLRILLAQGLSQDAYKQLVDAGVEQGGAYVQALVDGGQGSIQEVNDLTARINELATGLGNETANRMYQAGVDAAQGLVNGLTSLSAQLDSAAARLGQSIADAVKRALGIASPSKVMYGLMYDDVGDGIVGGLDAAGNKVDRAAYRLATRVAISPSLAAAYAAGRVPAAVSGNEGGGLFRDFVVNTPTSDPKAVAQEAINELTGRLP